MPDLEHRLNEGRRAVATMDPPADLWDRVVERSDHGDSVVVDLAAVRRRHTSAWLVVAAVVVLIALAGALVLYADDDDPVHTIDVGPAPDTDAPGVTVPQAPRPNTIVSGIGCPFGISAMHSRWSPDPATPLASRFDPDPGQGIAHVVLGSQVAEVRVPAMQLENEARWRMEDVRLDRGTARLWLDGPTSGGGNLPFVQVRWLPETGEPCDSFSVTVDGGSVAANRRTAVDVARRIVLPGELLALDLPGAEGGPVAGFTLAGTEWVVTSTTHSCCSYGGRGVVMSFSDTTVTWDNGCASVSAAYELDREEGFLALSDPTSTDPGCTPRTERGPTPPWSDIDRGDGRRTDSHRLHPRLGWGLGSHADARPPPRPLASGHPGEPRTRVTNPIYSMRMPEMARLMTSSWICSGVPRSVTCRSSSGGEAVRSTRCACPRSPG